MVAERIGYSGAELVKDSLRAALYCGWGHEFCFNAQSNDEGI